MRRLSVACVTLLAALTVACGDTIVNYPSPTQPTNQTTPAPNKPIAITFRVTGNAINARIRYSTPTDGLVQTTSTLPFFTSFNTTADNMFLSLEVTPISFSALTDFPFMSAQILTDNNLFRETTSTDFFLTTISVSGVWRR